MKYQQQVTITSDGGEEGKTEIDVELSPVKKAERKRNTRGTKAPAQSLEPEAAIINNTGIPDFDEKETLKELLQLLLRRLRMFAMVTMVFSFFFFGWCVLSFVITPPLVAVYGVISFFISSMLGGYLMTDRVYYSSLKERILLSVSCVSNLFYCLVAASAGMDEGYDSGTVGFFGVCAFVWFVLAYAGQRILGAFQAIAIELDYFADDEER
mmetsp:Transcript_12293/g.18445  ORF Transcript_12293/g.18445 Transcript_12293/m.18445 type:complete len:211 (-) Transcript_12293:183-815(-)|eukprot:CAMPEP_0196809098 /NCGR_PEP_ID=MMETSP1362-20130617/9074_1 /TAXON_ID=163516 /ORGANISM="Leptocylindrus danicus, Strain CCMP1856" /LENGTH=210 /DNA_ID=CAMNT_0042183675 /DNA_START=69 /DNA_END=701 /DNA_ORIENTATION=-